MLQSMCLALLVVTAMTETLSLYQWSRQADFQRPLQARVVVAAQVDHPYALRHQ